MTTASKTAQRTNRSIARLAEHLIPKLVRPVTLVGLMGSGKSAIGRRLAKVLALEFQDSDATIVKTAGISIAEIFDLAGEAKFREMEYSALSDLLSAQPQIIATGGGAFCQDKTATLLREKSLVVWLKATPATLLSRIGSTKSRPLLHTQDPLGRLTELLDKRTAFYEKAHIHVDTDGLTTGRAVRAALETLDTALTRQ